MQVPWVGRVVALSSGSVQLRVVSGEKLGSGEEGVCVGDWSVPSTNSMQNLKKQWENIMVNGKPRTES